MKLLVPADIQYKTKVKCLWVMVFLCLSFAMGDPGPCRYSITRDHLLTLRRLIENQLQSECSITYTFNERRNLSTHCYVKAALPWTLELLTNHFRYTRGSENHSFVRTLTGLIQNIYSQRCVPPINEELENDPVRFGMSIQSSPSEALQRVEDVLSKYWELVTTSNMPVDWSCVMEYTDTALPTELSLTTVSSIWDSEKAPQTELDEELEIHQKFGVMVIALSVFAGLLFIYTLYCIITHRMSHCIYDHTSQVNQSPRQ
ncbi:hypothetical protein UPYG_G00014610 [Umbra pygmaea]|uniref:Colony stimulating factor 1b (macrophage) n=1 Tax=Umbra pygmaea TaxID=75934 RepID=A0ABD0XJD8_UMBPY